MKISVVICTYNRGKYIGVCLKHLKNQEFSKNEYEIIIVNNKSTDDTEIICRKFIQENKDLKIKYCFEEQQGLSFARNTGIENAEGAIIVFIDDDAFTSANYLQEVLKGFDDPEVIAGGGKVLPVFEGKKPQWMNRFLLPLVAAVDLGSKPIPFPKNKFPVGANMFFKKSILKKVGLFNTKLGRTGSDLLGGEEKDIFFRLAKIDGKVVYLPDAKVDHIVPEKRVQIDYIKKQAIGIGVSERLRVGSLSFGFVLKKIIEEAVKVIGTFILSLFFIFTFRMEQGFFLLRFRIWVLKGYFC